MASWLVEAKFGTGVESGWRLVGKVDAATPAEAAPLAATAVRSHPRLVNGQSVRIVREDAVFERVLRLDRQQSAAATFEVPGA